MYYNEQTMKNNALAVIIVLLFLFIGSPVFVVASSVTADISGESPLLLVDVLLPEVLPKVGEIAAVSVQEVEQNKEKSQELKKWALLSDVMHKGLGYTQQAFKQVEKEYNSIDKDDRKKWLENKVKELSHLMITDIRGQISALKASIQDKADTQKTLDKIYNNLNTIVKNSDLLHDYDYFLIARDFNEVDQYATFQKIIINIKKVAQLFDGI